MFNRKKPPEQVRVRVIHSTSMRMEDWLGSDELVAYAQTLFGTPQFQTLLSVLRNESPANYGLSLGATHDDAIAHSYKATGYSLALNNLESMAQRREKVEPIKATFEPDNKQPV